MLELEEFKEAVEGVLGDQWEEPQQERGVAKLGSAKDAVEVREEMEEVGRGVCDVVRLVKVSARLGLCEL